MLNNKGEEVGIIYGWYNTLTDMWYIGQTIEEEKRFKFHIYDAINKKSNTHFHRALRKYGLDNWVYCVLEDNVLRENLNMKEQEWIEYYDSFHSGYNETVGGGQTIFSTEAKEKMANSHKGKTPWNKGKHHTKETRVKISNICKEYFKDKTPWNKGIPHTKETRFKISESCKGKPCGHPRPVNKYDLNGNYIQTYKSVKEAIKQNYKCSNICAVCRGKRKQAGGFIWKYAS